MGFLSSLGDLAKQFQSGEAGSGQLEQLLGAAPQSAVAGGLAQVFRSGETAPFTQQASVLNTLIAAAGPAVLAKLGGGSLAGLLGSAPGTVTPEQAAAVPPEEVQALAEHAEKQDPSIIDKLSQVYAAHPQMIQALGAAALAIAAKHISENHKG
jgi:hypothetical protein